MITASIVFYKTPPGIFIEAVDSFLKSVQDGVLIISDNSPEPLAHPILENPNVVYMFNGKNLGFGKAHNRAINSLPFESEFHLLLNPDVKFLPNVLPELMGVMRKDPSIGAVMPKVVYPDGSIQRLCKLLPTPMDLFIRRFIPFNHIQDRINRKYELHSLPQDSLNEVPTLSGCFLLVRTVLLKKVRGFDERYFMYMEDFDLVRRIGDHAKTVYVPSVFVEHEYAKGSYIDSTLMKYHLVSALKYFSKWGWWFDRVRGERNTRVLERLKKQSIY